MILYYKTKKNDKRIIKYYSNLEIIKMIEDNKLEVDNLCNVELSDKYKKVSTSGEKKISLVR